MIKKIVITFIALLLVLASGAFIYFSAGNEVYPEGLVAGGTAPDFTGQDQHNQTLHLSEMLKKGPVVLMFYRGFWCPSCQKHLAAFQDSLFLVTGKGASVVAVTPEKPAFTAANVDKSSSSISIIYDQGHTIMKSYNVAYQPSIGSQRLFTTMGIDIRKYNSDNTYTLPIPGVYIIGENRKIKYAVNNEGGLGIDYVSVGEILSNM